MKKKIQGIVVVEGKSDTQRLQQYYEVETFETSGLGLNDEMLAVLKELADKHRIIVFTDPDGPGERIRQRIMTELPSALHVMLHKADAISLNKKKIGVEHAEFLALEAAFAHIHELEDNAQCDFVPYVQRDMVGYGFLAVPDAKARRDYVAKELHLGTVNAKQFLKRLNLFMIDRARLEQIVTAYASGQEGRGNDGA
jgi:ribonuclease M5